MSTAMKIEILHVPDCPNLPLLDQRLHKALAGRPAVVTHRLVADVDTAARTGMTGSPTLLLDGKDPYAREGLEPSLSCRLYPQEDGHIEGAPSVDALRHTIDQYDTASTTHTTDTSGADQCCDPSDRADALRSARRRATPTDPTERAIHQAILRAFASTGHPPTTVELEHLAGPEQTTAVLQRLHDTDTIRLNPEGTIRAAYPFSANRTRHHLRLATGVEVYAMCAIDALGIPAMLHIDATITTHDPTTNDTITVTISKGHSTWSPPTVTAFVGSTADDGPSADTCCDHLNLFTNATTAQSWMDAHQEINGELLTADDAEALGSQIFGSLLGNR